MTNQVKCEIYYSIPGEPFALSEKDRSHIAHTTTILNIYTKEEEEVPNTTAIQQLAEAVTELSVPDPIKKGQFFNSETCCMFFNTAGEVLKVNGVHLFPVHMMRDGNDHERLHIKFDPPFYSGKHHWEKTSGSLQP